STLRRSSVLTYYSEKVFEYPAISEAIEGYPQKPNLVVLRSAAELLVIRLQSPVSGSRHPQSAACANGASNFSSSRTASHTAQALAPLMSRVCAVQSTHRR